MKVMEWVSMKIGEIYLTVLFIRANGRNLWNVNWKNKIMNYIYGRYIGWE